MLISFGRSTSFVNGSLNAMPENCSFSSQGPNCDSSGYAKRAVFSKRSGRKYRFLQIRHEKIFYFSQISSDSFKKFGRNLGYDKVTA